MDTVQMKVEFVFNKEVPLLIRRIAIAEYVRLREAAVNVLNTKYAEGNAMVERDNPEKDENDPLADYGGTKYCNFIREKQKPIIDRVNSEQRHVCIRLDTDEVGDLIAVNDRLGLRMHAVLKPM